MLRTKKKAEVDHLMGLIRATSDRPGGHFLLEGVHGSGKNSVSHQLSTT